MLFLYLVISKSLYIITFPSLSIHFPSSIHLFLSASLYPLASSYLNNLLSIYFFYFFPFSPLSFYLCIFLFPHLFIFYCNIVPELWSSAIGFPHPLTLVDCAIVLNPLALVQNPLTLVDCNIDPEPIDSGRLYYSSRTPLTLVYWTIVPEPIDFGRLYCI